MRHSSKLDEGSPDGALVWCDPQELQD